MEFGVAQPDQAQQLRRLMMEQEAACEEPAGRPPKLIVFSGGKAGVGTTTLAVNAAAAVARRGRRTVLGDLDLQGGDVGRMCALEEQLDVADVMSSHVPLATALRPGPAGLRVLAGCWAPASSQVFRQELHERLIGKLRGLGRSADYVIADAGNGATPLARALWRAADLVLVITAPDSVTLMDTYATMKALLDPQRRPRTQVVVNQAASEPQGREVYQRLAQSCRRFLGQTAEWAGSVPLDDVFATRGTPRLPTVLQSPTTASSRAIDRVAALIAVPATAPVVDAA